MNIDGWDFGPDQLMHAGEVAAAFKVRRSTVGSWAARGTLTTARAPGGMKLFSRQQVEHILRQHAGRWDLSPDQLMDTREVAAMFKVNRRTVGQWARDGKLAAISTGSGAWRYSRQQVEHIIRSSLEAEAQPDGAARWDFSPQQIMDGSEVAAVFNVRPSQVGRWADHGKLAFIRTPGRTRRYSREQVEHIFRGGAR